MNLSSCPCCSKKIMPRQILCSTHWGMVPDDLRETINQQKRNRGTPAWDKAVQDAVEAVQLALREKREIESYGFEYQ